MNSSRSRLPSGGICVSLTVSKLGSAHRFRILKKEGRKEGKKEERMYQ
jgi:hypothetical protein